MNSTLKDVPTIIFCIFTLVAFGGAVFNNFTVFAVATALSGGALIVLIAGKVMVGGKKGDGSGSGPTANGMDGTTNGPAK